LFQLLIFYWAIVADALLLKVTAAGVWRIMIATGARGTGGVVEGGWRGW
jgi:hypothetical protein